MKPELFTIGHSTHSWEQFLELLRLHRIDAIGDVRSSPHSARFPHFDSEVLKLRLNGENIRYVPLGAELGARRSERECYVDGVARYELIAETAAFRAGLNRIQTGTQRFRLALMCAEKDPLECHRAILVCRHVRTAYDIQHILSDGRLETHLDAERRLMNEEGLAPADLFTPDFARLTTAYDQRSGKIAYHESTEPVPRS